MNRKSEQSWFTYLLRCKDQTLYTGITTDLTQRLHDHNFTAKGAKYTRGRRPVKLVYSEEFPSRATAARREYQIKRLSRKEKEQLIQNSDQH
ncbi:MAG TPA: GIY-YIG nuclease family protein [Desulfobacterales bacterium]|nr:GIY-YIG nuclease family protein [Desulfobacterales bacterium]HIP39655.1 GIY-YIG nuclease family protein [Desulfocapsa sulfexigens]